MIPRLNQHIRPLLNEKYQNKMSVIINNLPGNAPERLPNSASKITSKNSFSKPRHCLSHESFQEKLKNQREKQLTKPRSLGPLE